MCGSHASTHTGRQNPLIEIIEIIYTVVPVCEMKGISQTRFFRKPDVCPVSEAKFRKPVLAGLRSNNEMNLFGFRRCYRSKKKSVNLHQIRLKLFFLY